MQIDPEIEAVAPGIQKMFDDIGHRLDGEKVGDIVDVLAFHVAGVITNASDPATIAMAKRDFDYKLESAIAYMLANPTPAGPVN